MSTRCMIGIENTDPDNKGVVAIYCHYDGYPAGVGATLKYRYIDRFDVIDLIALGDIASLGDTVDFTKAYERDYGETFHNFIYNNIDDFIAKAAYDGGAEYIYLFTLNNQWKCYNTYSKKFIELK